MTDMYKFGNEYCKRAHDRRTILVEARIMAYGKWHDCRILNISAGGAKLQLGIQILQDSVVQLEIGSFGQFGGTVVWQNGEDLGIKFTHSPAEMTEVVMGIAIYG